MALEVVGREQELASVDAFIGEAEGAPAALVLEGEPGIGKSTLWLAGVGQRGPGMRVLSSRPAEAEQGLAHAGLGDLLEDVSRRVLPALPPPRRRALEVALLLEDEAPARSRRSRARSASPSATRCSCSAGESRCSSRSTMCSGSTPSSASALAFALRRLGTEPRLPAARPAARRRERAVRARAGARRGALQRVPVGPLSVGALHRLLRDRLGKAFARQTLLRIHERSGGNPFFALELARVLDADVDPLEPLPVPETLDELVRARIAGLPGSTREALALAAALGTASDSLLERAGVAPDALEPALAAHVIERDERRDPLHASAAVVGRCTPTSVTSGRDVHGRIAAVVDDPVLRARHLALSHGDAGRRRRRRRSTTPSRLAGDRGASAVAAELAEQALRLTPPMRAPSGIAARSPRPARIRPPASGRAPARSRPTCSPRPTRPAARRGARAARRARERRTRGVELLEEALREATLAPALQSRHPLPPRVGRRASRRASGARCAHAHAALELADELDDDALRARARHAVVPLLGVGDPEAPAYTARARELAQARRRRPAGQVRDAVVGIARLGQERRARHARCSSDEYATWRERDELWAAHALWSLAWVESGQGAGSSRPTMPPAR